MVRDNETSPQLPLHLCIFIFILMMFLGLPLYDSYESLIEDLFDQLKLLVMLSPLLLLLAVHFLSDGGGAGRWGRLWRLIPLPDDRDSLHRAAGGGGTPWGVGFMLVFLFFMVSYHSQFQELCFPFLAG